MAVENLGSLKVVKISYRTKNSWLGLSDHFFDITQFMGVVLCLEVKNTRLINSIDSYGSWGMDDVVVFQQQAHVSDFSLSIVKKRQISGFAFFNKTKGLPLQGLLVSIAAQSDAVDLIDHLCKPRTIDPQECFSAP